MWRASERGVILCGNWVSSVPGNESQHLISIPVSLGVGANQQIQLLSTSNGQIFAANLTNLQSLGKPLNLGIINPSFISMHIIYFF